VAIPATRRAVVPLADAYPNVRVRVKDASNSPTVYACSVDHFQCGRPRSPSRPARTRTRAARARPYAGREGGCDLRADRDRGRRLQRNAIGHGSAVTVNPLSPGIASGSFGATNASNGVATGNFTYSEAGYFTLNTDRCL